MSFKSFCFVLLSSLYAFGCSYFVKQSEYKDTMTNIEKRMVYLEDSNKKLEKDTVKTKSDQEIVNLQTKKMQESVEEIRKETYVVREELLNTREFFKASLSDAHLTVLKHVVNTLNSSIDNIERASKEIMFQKLEKLKTIPLYNTTPVITQETRQPETVVKPVTAPREVKFEEPKKEVVIPVPVKEVATAPVKEIQTTPVKEPAIVPVPANVEAVKVAPAEVNDIPTVPSEIKEESPAETSDKKA